MGRFSTAFGAVEHRDANAALMDNAGGVVLRRHSVGGIDVNALAGGSSASATSSNAGFTVAGT